MPLRHRFLSQGLRRGGRRSVGDGHSVLHRNVGSGTGVFRLGIPNKEIRETFATRIKAYFLDDNDAFFKRGDAVAKAFLRATRLPSRRGLQNPAFSVEDSKVSVATCTATTQMASIFRICGTAGSSPAIFMSKEGTKPRQVESTDLSTG